ncbi:MAG: hypothetical protein RL189_1748 [Pseudomonadota bacterium]|jgi:hypothetical protein
MIRFPQSKIALLGVIFSVAAASCGKKKNAITEDIASREKLASSLAVALTAQGLSEEQAKKIANSGKDLAATKMASSALLLTPQPLSLGTPDTPAEKEISGFVEGAVAALDEAGVKDKSKILAVLGTIVEVVQKSFSERKDELKDSLKDLPAVVADASMSGLKSSGVAQEDLDEALKEITKEIIENLEQTGLEKELCDDAASGVISETVGSLDEFGIPKESIDDYSTFIMAGAMDGIPSDTPIEEITLWIKEMSEAIADGMKDTNLSDAELALAMQSVSKAASESVDDIGVSKEYWAKISEAMTEGMVAGLDDAGMSKEYFDDAIKAIAQGAVEGSESLNSVLSDEELAAYIKAASEGAAAGVTELNLPKEEFDDFAKMAAEGAGAGLADVEIPDSLKQQMETSIADAMRDGLADSGLSQEELDKLKADSIAAAETGADSGESKNSVPSGSGTPTESNSGEY